MKKLLLLFFLLLKICINSAGQENNKLDSLKAFSQFSSNDTIKLKAYQELFDIYLQSNLDSALKYVLKKKELSVEIGDSSEIAKAIKELGTTYWSKENFIDALENYRIALSIYSTIGDSLGIAACTNNLGLINYTFGNYGKATEYYLKALKIFEQEGDEKSIAVACNNLGIIFREQLDYIQARQYLLKALKINEKLSYKNGIIDNYINLGLVADSTDTINSSINYYKKALKLSKKINATLSEANCYSNIAGIYADKNELDTALEYYEKAIELNKIAGNPDENVYNYSNIGILYSQMGYSNKAIKYYLRCYNLASTLGIKSYIEHSASSLAFEYENRADYKNAYKYLIIARVQRDSLFNEDTKLNINKLEMKHVFDKKMHETELQQVKNDILHQAELEKERVFRNYAIGGAFMLLILLILALYSYRVKKKSNQDLLIKNAEIGNQSEEINQQNEMLIIKNEKITEQKEKIEKLNRSKDKIFSIIGHDLRNVVGTTASSLNYLAENEFDFESETTKLLVKELRNNAKRTFSLLENLLSWGKSQLSNLEIKPKNFDVSIPINETIDFLKSIAQKKNINVVTNFNTEKFVYADEESIKMVIRNLVSNAIKYSQKNSEVNISIKEESHKIKISVTDNGIGISNKELVEIRDRTKFYTTNGTALEVGAGLGLRLCRDYLKANNSSLQVNSEVNSGSEFYFYLPKTELETGNPEL